MARWRHDVDQCAYLSRHAFVGVSVASQIATVCYGVSLTGGWTMRCCIHILSAVRVSNIMELPPTHVYQDMNFNPVSNETVNCSSLNQKV